MPYFNLYDHFPSWFLNFSIPFLILYQMFCSSAFFNTEVQNLGEIDRLANASFRHVHYLCAARKAKPLSVDQYTYSPKFSYRERFWEQSIQAVLELPPSLFFGTVLKFISYLYPEVRGQYFSIAAFNSSYPINSNQDYYHNIGLNTSDYRNAQPYQATHIRRPGSEQYMSVEKQALKELVDILNQYSIPFWVDCGTCLGAYRYNGVIPWDEDIDIAILMPDAKNVKNAFFKNLDPAKYFVFDSSSRLHPNSYLKVFVREAGEFIDIYHFNIFPETKTIEYFLSLEENIFLPNCWRIRERRFVKEAPFSQVFPLKKANFDGVEVPLPNDAVSYLQVRYGENIEPAKVYNEITDAYEKDLSHPYWEREFVH